jgi:hypothetical protein
MGRPNAVLLICLLCLGSADGETRGRLAMSQEHRVHGRGRSALVFNGWRARPVLDYECIHDKQVNRLRGGAAESGEEPKVIALVASTCPDKVLALTNHVYLNTADIERIFHTATARYLQISGFFFTASASDAVAVGCVALNSAQRKTLRVSSGENVEATPLEEIPDAKMHAASIELAVDFAGRSSANEVLPLDFVAAHIVRSLSGQVLTVGQHFVSEARGLNLIFSVKSVLTFKDAPPSGATPDSPEVRALWSSGGVMRTGLMGIVGDACKVGVVAVKGSLLKITNTSPGAAARYQFSVVS